MDRKKFAIYLCIASILILIPIFIIAGAFTFDLQLFLSVFTAVTMIFLFIGVMYIRKGLRTYSWRFGRSTARTPIGVGIAMILFGYFFYFTQVSTGGPLPVDWVIPPQAVVQGTLVVILTLSSVILALMSAIIFKPPEQQKQSTT